MEKIYRFEKRKFGVSAPLTCSRQSSVCSNSFPRWSVGTREMDNLKVMRLCCRGKKYRSETVAMLYRFLFGATIVVILVMTLLGSDSLNELYLFVAQILPIDSAWVKKHATEISNIGHLISCFILTCFGFSVFRKNYLKGIFCVAGLEFGGQFI